jgi:hypothetical protein
MPVPERYQVVLWNSDKYPKDQWGLSYIQNVGFNGVLLHVRQTLAQILAGSEAQVTVYPATYALDRWKKDFRLLTWGTSTHRLQPITHEAGKDFERRVNEALGRER